MNMNNLVFYASKVSKIGLDAIRHKCLTNITSVQLSVNKKNSIFNDFHEALFGGPNENNIKLNSLIIGGERSYITKYISAINNLFKF